MSGDVTAEDREKAIQSLVAAKFASARPDYSALLDSLIGAGWRPGGAPARPDREALAQVISESIETRMGVIGPREPNVLREDLELADALRAADHLWTAQPSWRICEAGCGCRYGTDDPDAKDCGCDGPCTTDPRFMHQQPSAPVVDREALAQAIHNMIVPGMAAAKIARGSIWHTHASELIASGLFVDRATVEAEQREKDAQTAERHIPWDPSEDYKPGERAQAASQIAAAIRAGGANA